MTDLEIVKRFVDNMEKTNFHQAIVQVDADAIQNERFKKAVKRYNKVVATTMDPDEMWSARRAVSFELESFLDGDGSFNIEETKTHWEIHEYTV